MRYSSVLAYCLVAVKALEQQTIFILHARPIVPLLPRVVTDRCCLPIAMRVPVLNGHKILVLNALTIGHSQREAHHWSIEWAPYVHDTVSALEQLLCVLWRMEPNALGGRHRCLVNVHSLHRIAVASWSPDCVIKQNDSICAWDVVQQKLLDLRVVDAAYPLVILELGFVALNVLICVERVVVKIELVLLTAQVIQPYFLPTVTPVPLGDAWKRLNVVVWWRAILWSLVE
jgi:hypothetical protein